MTDIVYVDFNNVDSFGRVRLNSIGTTNDIQKLSLRLAEGLLLIISDNEMRAKGVVEFSNKETIWVVNIDEDTVREL